MMRTTNITLYAPFTLKTFSALPMGLSSCGIFPLSTYCFFLCQKRYIAVRVHDKVEIAEICRRRMKNVLMSIFTVD